MITGTKKRITTKVILIPCGLYWTRTSVPLQLPSRNLNRRDCPPDRSLVSVDLTADEISATGSPRRFAPIDVNDVLCQLSQDIQLKLRVRNRWSL